MGHLVLSRSPVCPQLSVEYRTINSTISTTVTCNFNQWQFSPTDFTWKIRDVSWEISGGKFPRIISQNFRKIVNYIQYVNTRVAVITSASAVRAWHLAAKSLLPVPYLISLVILSIKAKQTCCTVLQDFLSVLWTTNRLQMLCYRHKHSAKAVFQGQGSKKF